MKVLITGSAGHLGEALMRTLQSLPYEAVGLDTRSSHLTHHVGSITQRDFVRQSMDGVNVVLHTATLHKPHLATHTHQDFVDTNVTGTLNLLQEAAAARVSTFVFTSTTSVYGNALTPPIDAPAAWITEGVTPLPRNIYGITKLAAEQLCEMFHARSGLNCIVLRTSRFFPEEDDSQAARERYDGLNLKVNEFLYRRVELEDVVTAHLLAMERGSSIGFDRFIISATTPFTADDVIDLRRDAESVIQRRVEGYEREYTRRGWSMPRTLDRVYVNERARTQLGWRPRYDFSHVIQRLLVSEDYRSPLARAVGSKGYHLKQFTEGPYPTE